MKEIYSTLSHQVIVAQWSKHKIVDLKVPGSKPNQSYENAWKNANRAPMETTFSLWKWLGGWLEVQYGYCLVSVTAIGISK